MKIHYYKKDILEICNKKHLTVEEIFKKIVKKYPDAGKSSIYRNVEELVASNDLKKIIGVGKKSYFEKNIGDHIHLVDECTGDIIDLETKIKIPNLPKNFKLKNIDVKIFGEFY